MTDIAQALAELEAESNIWIEKAVKHGCHIPLMNAINNVAVLRAKEARENALYAHQWGKDEEPGPVVPLSFIRSITENRSGELYALHPFDKAEGKYTGEVITGQELAKLLGSES